MVFSAWLGIQEGSALKWQFSFLPETGLILKNVVGIFFGSALNVYWFPSPQVWFAPLVRMVPCPGPSKKSCFHGVISGFGLGPRFDSVDLRPDTLPVALPSPPHPLLLWGWNWDLFFAALQRTRNIVQNGNQGTPDLSLPQFFLVVHLNTWFVQSLSLFSYFWHFPFPNASSAYASCEHHAHTV